MRKLFLLLFSAISICGSSQDYLGYAHSNYSGIVGASYNPASLADNNYSMDILICGAGLEVGNNYVGVKRSTLNSTFGPQDLILRSRETKKAAFVRSEILLPGIMFSNGKRGWGVDMKVRTYANVEGLSEDLAHIFAFELDDPIHFEHSLYNRHIGITAMSWFELGGTYAQTIWTGAEHYVSVGVRPKFILGLGGFYAFVNDAGYNFRNDSTLSIDRADVDFGLSDNFTFNNSLQPSWKLGFNPGLGVDAGISYEFRPDELQKDESEKKKEKEWPGFRERPVYKYRIGVSITDLGFVHFHHGEFSDHYALETNLWDYDNDVWNPTSPAPLYSLFDQRSQGNKKGSGMWMRLPLALNVQYDYFVGKFLYINATAFSGIYLRNNDGKKVHELTRISITPRWDKRWYGVWMPVSFSRFGNLSVGTGLRVGPFIIGTTNLLPLLFKNKTTYTADLYFALKVPLFPTGKSGGKKRKLNTNGKVDDCPK
jgi:hypothetical protein